MTPTRRVHVLIDYQNLHMSAHETFVPDGTPHAQTLIHPGKFVTELMAVREAAGRPAGEVGKIFVYRGRPSPDKEQVLASLNDAQRSRWLWDQRVEVISRPLRYPHNWPEQPAREKGIDVKLACDLLQHAIGRRADILILVSLVTPTSYRLSRWPSNARALLSRSPAGRAPHVCDWPAPRFRALGLMRAAS